MAQSLPSTHIEAQVGNVSGGSQVAIGNYIVQIGHVEGGVVNILNNAPPPPKARPQPVSLRPKAFPGLLDRDKETTNIIEALQVQQSVECTGEPGSGKTSLLRHLAHQSQLSTIFQAGVVYFQVNQQSAPDLLKSLFDAFYTCDFPIKPSETEIRFFLESVHALVLLDDVEITAQQIETLMNVAPNCTFVVVTKERCLLGETLEVPLKGLPTSDAVRLFQRELRRTLSAEEQKGAQLICESVACIPLQVLRAAHKTREQNSSLLAVVSEGQLATGDPRLVAAEVKSSSEN
ncbi:MAG TPA: NACHT domain-containing protein, partial [Pyrinomonadaceae bacterium]